MSKPQDALDRLLSSLAFDPLEYTKAPEPAAEVSPWNRPLEPVTSTWKKETE